MFLFRFVFSSRAAIATETCFYNALLFFFLSFLADGRARRGEQARGAPGV